MSNKQAKLGLKYGFPEQKKPSTMIVAPQNLLANCELWEFKNDFPELAHLNVNKFYMLKEFKSQLFDAFMALRGNGLLGEIKTFDGCYNLRLVRGSVNTWSLHSWAAAIDINSSDNPLNGKVSWSNEFLQVMREYVDCGADFKRVDGMHFELKI